jgi:hypothetical protein
VIPLHKLKDSYCDNRYRDTIQGPSKAYTQPPGKLYIHDVCVNMCLWVRLSKEMYLQPLFRVVYQEHEIDIKKNFITVQVSQQVMSGRYLPFKFKKDSSRTAREG